MCSRVLLAPHHHWGDGDDLKNQMALDGARARPGIGKSANGHYDNPSNMPVRPISVAVLSREYLPSTLLRRRGSIPSLMAPARP